MRQFRLLFAVAAALGAWLAMPAAAQTALRMNISVAQNSHYGVAIDSGTMAHREHSGAPAGSYLRQLVWAMGDGSG